MLQHYRLILEDIVLPKRSPAPPDLSLKEAVAWIYRAQDATPDRGVSHSYHARRGWAPSYPETTGYIIPTLLNWWQMSGDEEARRRALEMAQWECDVQLPDGAVMASTVARTPVVPAVFNTGQVIFGWIAAYRISGNERFLDAANRAGTWLCEQLGDSDTWRAHGNMGQAKPHAYHIRVVWALAELAKHARRADLWEPVRRTTDWTLRQEASPGWFDNNCLTDTTRPLLHTIAYTAEGLLATGLLADDDRAVQAARRTADALLARIDVKGRMAGRFQSDWTEAANWSCVTGISQMAIVWQRLATLDRVNAYRDAARRANSFVRRVQRVRSGVDGVRGALPGSYPIHGQYLKCRFPNWATKFHIDAQLLEQLSSEDRSIEYYPG